MAAEFAATLPAAILIFSLCIGGITISAHRISLQDIAANSARAAARGESSAVVSAAARALPGSSVSLSSQADLVCATARFRPAALMAVGLTLSARSCALGGGR